MGIIHKLQKIRSHKRFSATDVELKNLHGRQRIDDLETFFGGKFTFSFGAGIRKAMNAAQVAGVGHFPCDVHGCRKAHFNKSIAHE
jgi:hypothetical protein